MDTTIHGAELTREEARAMTLADTHIMRDVIASTEERIGRRVTVDDMVRARQMTMRDLGEDGGPRAVKRTATYVSPQLGFDGVDRALYRMAPPLRRRGKSFEYVAVATWHDGGETEVYIIDFDQHICEEDVQVTKVSSTEHRVALKAIGYEMVGEFARGSKAVA